jgi:hypothetical protein
VTSVPTIAVSPITSGSRLDTMLPKTNSMTSAITGAARSSIRFRSSWLRWVTSRSTAGCPPGRRVSPSCAPLIRSETRASVALRWSSSPVIRARTSAVAPSSDRSAGSRPAQYETTAVMPSCCCR